MIALNRTVKGAINSIGSWTDETFFKIFLWVGFSRSIFLNVLLFITKNSLDTDHCIPKTLLVSVVDGLFNFSSSFGIGGRIVQSFVSLGFRSSLGIDFIVSSELEDHLVKLKPPSKNNFFRSFETEIGSSTVSVA